MIPLSTYRGDVEAQQNNSNTATDFSWHNLTVSVKEHKTKKALNILENVTGSARSGDIVALMGPSGSGKTTLLNVLAGRDAAGSASVSGTVLMEGKRFRKQALREVSTFVEQEDALIGSLSVRETIEFASMLSSPGSEKERVGELIRAFGLEKQQNTIIGTVLKKGISGGQKRRVSIASQLITRPKILFLDEPTSGLDSTAAYEVMARIRHIAREENMIVIASIHQPSTKTFNLFSHLILLSRGRTVYSGRREDIQSHFDRQGLPIPIHENPAEFLVDICNLDFQREIYDGDTDAEQRVENLITAWASIDGVQDSRATSKDDVKQSQNWKTSTTSAKHARGTIYQTFVLLRRLWLKSYRDALPYWIRVVMYLGLAIMMGTVWLRLDLSQANINPFISALFFSSAFMAFMAVSYVPAYLEDYLSYQREYANGLYGPGSFLLSNFLIALPFLFLISLLFSIVTVFLVNMKHDAESFFASVMWLFLDLIAAESLVVLVSSLIPNFVGALAIVAFANGLFMSVGGFLVSQDVLNVFWYYTFYWIDYQRYVFQGLMWKELAGREFACESVGEEEFQCMYKPIQGQPGKIAGETVLHSMGYSSENRGLWVGLLIAIIVAMRLITFGYLKFVRGKMA